MVGFRFRVEELQMLRPWWGDTKTILSRRLILLFAPTLAETSFSARLPGSKTTLNLKALKPYSSPYSINPYSPL